MGGVKLLELRSAHQLPVDLPVSHRKVTVVLDLPADGDALMKAFPAKLRSQVRRPEKEGVTYRFGADQVEPFYARSSPRHMRDLGTPTQGRRLFDGDRPALPRGRLVRLRLAGRPTHRGRGRVPLGERIRNDLGQRPLRVQPHLRQHGALPGVHGTGDRSRDAPGSTSAAARPEAARIGSSSSGVGGKSRSGGISTPRGNAGEHAFARSGCVQLGAAGLEAPSARRRNRAWTAYRSADSVSLFRQLPAWSPLTLGALLSGVRAAWFTDGRRVRQSLDADLRSAYQPVGLYLTDSGTSALTLALRVAEAATHAPVALPAYCCYDVATAADGAGVPFHLYDIDPATLSPDMESLRRAFEAGRQDGGGGPPLRCAGGPGGGPAAGGRVRGPHCRGCGSGVWL